MKTAAVICEYNPFHNGHKYQIDSARSLTDCDRIVALMSGNYVQRGDFSIYPKFLRAKAALFGGIDLVLENPAVFTLRSAEGYAHSAVFTLDSLGCVDYLVFGAESDNCAKLKDIAALLVKEPEEYRKSLKAHLSHGMPYAAARGKSVSEFIGDDAEELLKSPNNLLAVEYLKALLRLNSKITPVLIQRKAVDHHSDTITGEFASASHIRSLLCDEFDMSALVPKECNDIYDKAPHFDSKYAECAILSSLALMNTEELANTPDISEGLENKIVAELKNHTTLDDLIMSVKSKRYPYSRIRRALLCAFLKITKTDAELLPKYIKILDFNDKGREILNAAKKTSSLTLAKNASAVMRDFEAMALWKRELTFDRVYEIIYSSRQKDKFL